MLNFDNTPVTVLNSNRGVIMRYSIKFDNLDIYYIYMMEYFLLTVFKKSCLHIFLILLFLNLFTV